MKSITSLTISVLTMLATSVSSQPLQQPSSPGETLSHSQSTIEYYELQRKLNKGQQRINEKGDGAVENTGNQEEIEIIEEENGRIRFFDEPDPVLKN